MCEFKPSCRNANTFGVNAAMREAQILCCAVHLPAATRWAYSFNDDRYTRRTGSLVRTFVITKR